ncbi:anthranilate phosphoribosyltransferase [Rhodovibrionaceae bacterium A322]
MTGDLTDLRALIALAADGQALSQEQSQQAFEIMMSGDATPSQMGGLLMSLRVRGETVPEIIGAATAMRAKMSPIKAPAGAIDTCGTGGDAKGTLNVSSASAFVVAACGVPVAKHGNRSLSSRSGAADVLTSLGVNTDAEFSALEQALTNAGTCFLMAPRHHSAMRHVMPTRVELGTRTLFNLLGPLCNPGQVKKQMIGVFSRDWIEPLAHVLKGLGHEAAWLVHGEGGYDEMTTTGTNYVAQLKDGTVTTFEVTPEDAGLPRGKEEDLLGGDGPHNAKVLMALLEGEKSTYRDTVVLSSAAALVMCGKASDLKDGVARAQEALDSRAAKGVLEKMLTYTGL